MWATAGSNDLKTLTDAIGFGVGVMEVCGDRRFRVLSINRRIESVTKLQHAEVVGLFLDDIHSPPVASRLAERYQRCVDERQTLEYEESADFPAGRVFWKTVLTPIEDDCGQVVRVLVSSTNIVGQQIAESELRKTAKALRESESRLQAAVQGAELGIWEWNLQARSIWVADYWAASLQTFNGPVTMSIEQWSSILHPEDRAAAIGAAERVIRGEVPNYGIECRYRRHDGGWQWRHVYGTATEHDERGRPLRISGVLRDIDQQRMDQEKLHKLTAELEYRAIHDSLTGALDRGAIIEVLDKEIARAQREGTAVTVALIDADHFKKINDTHGHQVGDYTLREMVTRIQEVLRPYDHLGRYGGEEFLVVAPTSNGVTGLHERIRDAIACKPFSTAAGDLTITVSIGVAASDQNTSYADQLILRADEALYRAKKEGRNRVVNTAQLMPNTVEEPSVQ